VGKFSNGLAFLKARSLRSLTVLCSQRAKKLLQIVGIAWGENFIMEEVSKFVFGWFARAVGHCYFRNCT
tara:strand:- start:1938 stop:2144 length:207 start_codon:yes stop_codon:yes gene_type:complete